MKPSSGRTFHTPAPGDSTTRYPQTAGQSGALSVKVQAEAATRRPKRAQNPEIGTPDEVVRGSDYMVAA